MRWGNKYLRLVTAIALALAPLLIQPSPASAVTSEQYVSGTQSNISGDDVAICSLPIGFTFNFYGSSNTTICQSINGVLSFTNYAAYSNSALTTNSVPGMYPFWDDLHTNATGLASLRYATTGTSPNRKFIAQWTNIYFFGTDLQLGTFQVVLYETSNKIQFQYRDILGSGRPNGTSATVGIASTAQAIQYSQDTASLSQGQAISFTPSSSTNYTMNSTATYDPVYVTLPGEPSQAVLANPPDGATGVTTSPTFEWNSATGATSYKIYISTDISFSNLVPGTPLDVGNVTSYNYSQSLSQNTTYFWRIGSVNSTAELLSATRSFTTSVPNNVPNVPTNLAGSLQQGSAINKSSLVGSQLTMNISDPDSGQLVRYRVQISSENTFNTGLIIDYRSTSNAQGAQTFTFGENTGTYLVGTASTLLSTGNYYLRVRAEDSASGSSSYTTVAGVAFSVTVNPPSAPTIDSLTIGNGTLAVALTHGSNGGSALTSIKYATSTDGVNFSANPIDLGSAPTNFTISGLTNATNYYVRVLAVNAAGSSAWSNVLNATPGAPPSIPSLDNVYSLEDKLFIRFTPSANAYGFPITAYQYSTDNGSTWANLAGLTSPQTIDSTSAGVALVSGNSYSLIIRAINEIGPSASSSSITSHFRIPTLFQTGDYVLGGSPKATINSSTNVSTLTAATGGQFGSIWSGKRIDLTKDFVIEASVKLSNGVFDGADGMAFVIQPASTAAGGSGGGLGYQGLTNSFAVEFDTYDNGSGADPVGVDHIAYVRNGNAGTASQHTPYYAPSNFNLEDGAWRDVRFIWNSNSKVLSTEYKLQTDSTYTQIISASVDLRSIIGVTAESPYTYWGFTAATGGQYNQQQVKITSYSAAGRPNASPTISAFTNATILPSTTSSPVGFTYSDDESTVDQFILTATSSDQTLIKDSDLTFTSKTTTGANLTYKSLNKSGTATITVRVQDADGAVVTSSFDVTVFGPASAPTNLQLTASDGTLSGTFTAIPDASLGGGTLARYEYQLDSGNWVSINSNNFFTVSGLTNNTNYTIKVRAVTTRSGNTQYGTTASATNKPNIPPALVDSPTISGSARYGQTFTASSGSWSNLGITYHYEWQRSDTDDSSGSWEAISGATSSTYVTTADDLGKFIRVKVTATNSAGNQISYSLSSTEILDAPATIDTDPVISGTTTVDSQLSVTPGTWNGTRNSRSYQWFRAGISGGTDYAIPGATGTTYILTPDDAGRRIYVVETARNTYSRNGVDALSNISVAISKNTQTVSNFVITGAKPFSETSRSVTADNDRNLTITFESITPTICSAGAATRSGATSTSQVTYLAAGTCTVVAKQLGTTGYLASNEISQSFDIEISTPSVPRSITTAVDGTKIKTSWTAPLTNGGSAISSYLVTATSGGTSLTCTTTTTTCDIDGLTAGTTYDVIVTATNTTVGATTAKTSAASTAVRAAIPAASASTISGTIPTKVSPKPVTSLLGNVSSANQTALINSGVIAPPPSVPVINVSADLSSGSINTSTTVVVSQTVESGAQIDLAIKPPSDTPVGTSVFGTLTLADGTVFDLGQIGITSSHLTSGFSLSPFTILPVGKHFIELRFGEVTTAQSVYSVASFGFSTLAQSAPSINALSTGSQINVKFAINIVAGANGVPTIQKETPTPTPSRSVTPTPTPSETEVVAPTPTSEPSVQAQSEPEATVDSRGLTVTNPLTDAPLAVAETTLTAVALVAAVTAATSAASAVAAAAGAAASAGAAAAGGAAGAASGGASGGSASRSAGGSGSGGSGSGSSGSGGGTDTESGEGEDDASIEGVEFEHEGFEAESIAWGDGLKVWSIPVVTALDEPSHRATEKLAPITPLVSKLIADPAYLKAILGSLSLIFPVLGIVLGIHGVSESAGQLLPPTAPIITAIAVIGVLDAFAGFIAMAIYTVGMILTAGVHNAADVRMLLGLVIIGFGPSLLASAFRGLRRQTESGHHYWWERLTDFAVAPFLGGWATKGMVEALTPLAGVELPIHDHANAIAWSVAIALVARIALEEISSRFYPSRLNFIHPTDVPSPTNLQKVIALTMRAGIFFFVAGAFIGNSWHLYVGTFLFIAPSYLGLIQDRFPNYPKLYQILPAGLPGLAFTLLVASASLSALTSVLGETPDLAQIAFVVLPIPSVILSILGMFGREPAEGDVRWYQRSHLTWLYRIGGVAMLVYTMRLTGII